jgi:hypothetical protein
MATIILQHSNREMSAPFSDFFHTPETSGTYIDKTPLPYRMSDDVDALAFEFYVACRRM